MNSHQICLIIDPSDLLKRVLMHNILYINVFYIDEELEGARQVYILFSVFNIVHMYNNNHIYII